MGGIFKKIYPSGISFYPQLFMFRLCGSVMCKECSKFVEWDFCRKLINPSTLSIYRFSRIFKYVLDSYLLMGVIYYFYPTCTVYTGHDFWSLFDKEFNLLCNGHLRKRTKLKVVTIVFISEPYSLQFSLFCDFGCDSLIK